MVTKSVRAIERAIDVMDVIKANGGTAGVSEISRQVGLSKSCVHRILTALVNGGMVRKHDLSDRYSFAHKILELASAASRQWDLVSLAMPYLEDLRDRLNETAVMALRVGSQFTYIAQAVRRDEYYFTPTLGRHYPLHSAAPGKAILAFLPLGDIEHYLANGPLAASTARTITDPIALEQEIDRIRRVGYAISAGERVEGAAAIAAPIRNRQGFAYAAICIVGPESRLRDLDLKVAGELVTEISRRAEQACLPVGIEQL